MISGTISAVLITSVFSHHGLRKGSRSLQIALLSFLFLVAVIVFVCRPIIMWMIRRTPEGKPIKETTRRRILDDVAAAVGVLKKMEEDGVGANARTSDTLLLRV
ncbi:Cation/H+ exchanger [Arachis hypogaea]|nr:Cation/H+ exchanger [Arachis hypogaea]